MKKNNLASKIAKIQSFEVLSFAGCLKESNTEDSYNKSYYYFVEYFKNKDLFTEQDLIIGANFTYGWMPTILNFKNSEFEKAVSILNLAKGTERISNEQLLMLKKLINNSLVGVSKLLHFINPDVYAIWDSRVCHFLLGKSYQYIVQNHNLFWLYLDLCSEVSSNFSFMKIHTQYKEKVGFEVSPFRTIEQIMFISGKKHSL